MRTEEFAEDIKRIIEDYLDALMIRDVLDIDVDVDHRSESDECRYLISIR